MFTASIFLYSCVLNVLYWIAFQIIYSMHTGKVLTNKQQAYILSIKSSLVLSCIGLVSLQTNIPSLEYIAVHYFLSYLICDMMIGNIVYPAYMKSLSGNVHHSIYVLISFVALYTENQIAFINCFVEEIPTALLGLGSFDSAFRNDHLFGFVFFCLRIAFHSWYLATQLDNTIFVTLGTAALGLHLYWFKNWTVKYLNL